MPNSTTLSEDALSIWTAAVAAVQPEQLLMNAVALFPRAWQEALANAPHILVVGGGKAGAAMAASWEAAMPGLLTKTVGLLNVPEPGPREPQLPTLSAIRLHPARPAGSNHPTEAGVAGTEEMLRWLTSAGPEDVAVCLISGGGSALLPAPAEGITLADKQAVTKLLHASGATISEMNAVRKHLSRSKGGRFASAFSGKLLLTLLISDVVGDPLDVIASGPTAADPSTFTDALAILQKFHLWERVPISVRRVLESGATGQRPETLKQLPSRIQNVILGSNTTALQAAAACAESLGYQVVSLGPFVEGETQELGIVVAGMVQAIRAGVGPARPPACLLIGGETTVSLGDSPGKGGRNQEFVLAVAQKLKDLTQTVILSGGTDGEDGPTDAAGAFLTAELWARGQAHDPLSHLVRHDAYPFFDRIGGLIRTGMTGTNVMDVRVVLVCS
ncbi:MAG: DUF4147 domain-containing protein [Bacteroidales bacterium]|nr:DUF4147 domain-containing protein [Bacteroidales bacterium]